MALIEVWDKKTGEKVRVAESVVNHAKLGKRYSRSPLKAPATKPVVGKKAGKKPAEKEEGDS